MFNLSHLIRRIARHAGYSLERLPSPQKPFPNISYATRYLADAIRNETGGKVSAGPFKGMKMSDENPWTPLDEPSRLLGSYEEEIHPALEAAISRKPELVVNIGSGDGYYSTGLALRLPSSSVVAFDVMPEAQQATRRSAELNDVSERVEARGPCSATELVQFVNRKKALIVCDCEGFERDLFTEQNVGDFGLATLLIECHDFIRPGTVEYLAGLFSPSHDVQRIPEGARNPNKYPMVANRDSTLRWLSMCEFRPTLMTWLSVVPKI